MIDMYDFEADEAKKALAGKVLDQLGPDTPLAEPIAVAWRAGEWDDVMYDAFIDVLDGYGDVSPRLVEEAINQWPDVLRLSDMGVKLQAWLQQQLVDA